MASTVSILNSGGTAASNDENPEELGRHLQQAMLQIKADHVGADGHGVDYAALKSSKAFSEYVQVAGQLVKCNPAPLSQDERMAFFINVYNCLTIHGLAVSEQLPTSVLQLNKFWSQTAYSINGLTFSLDDIEHGILRGNRPHPSANTPPFGADDPRRVMCMKECDPCIHFTLVCGAKSCPAIQVYSAKNLERGLKMAARNFCSQEAEVIASERKVRLNKIFMWYGSDFASNERDLLRYISQHVSDDTKATLEQMLASNEEVSVEYKDYNWSLNSLL